MKDFVTLLKREWQHDNVGDVAGALTFQGVLSLFPFLLFVVALASAIINPAQAEELVRQLGRVAPHQVTGILTDQIHSLTSSSKPGLLTISGLGAIWAASGGVTALTRAFNTAYDVSETRSFIKLRALAFGVTLGGAVLVILATGIAIAAPAIANAIGGPVGVAILWLRLPIATLIMMLVLALLYYLLPNVEQQFKFITPGSVVAVVVWLLVSVGFSIYVQNFGKYDVMYGALGGIIVLLLWMWISAQVVLLGAEMNAVLEHLSPEGKRVGARSMRDHGVDLPKSEKKDVEQGVISPELAKSRSPVLTEATAKVASETDAAREPIRPPPVVLVRPKPRPRRVGGIATGLAAFAFGIGFLFGRRS